MTTLLDIIMIETYTDIPSDLRTSAYQLHNRVKHSNLWNTTDRETRQLVLSEIREWTDWLRAMIETEDPRKLPQDYRNDLRHGNNFFTNSKESGTGCSSCRVRMFNRLKNKFKIYEDNI